MTVTCTGCGVHFRVSDDKIGPRGARLRCSRCGTAFTVGPPASAPADPLDRAAPAWPEDPFPRARGDLAGGFELEEPEPRPAPEASQVGEVPAPDPLPAGPALAPEELLDEPGAPSADPEPPPAPPPAPAPAPVTSAPPRSAGTQGAGPAALRGAIAVAALLAVAAAILALAFSQRRSERGPGGAVVTGVSSVLYDTAAGRPVLVVRGEVRAGSAPLATPQLDVAVVDGDRVVARGRALAGAVPSPDEVFAIDGADGTDRLAALLAVRARARLEPGEAAPFGAVVADVPPGAERLAVRVSVVP